MKFNTAICSYLFFSLMIFNVLALTTSEFLPIFSQVFTLLTQNGKIYDIFSLIILISAILMLCINPIRIYRRKDVFGKTTSFMIFIFSCVILVVLIALLYWLWHKIFTYNTHNTIAMREQVQVVTWQSYYVSVEFYISLTCWICLVVLPLLYKVLSLNLNIKHRIGRTLLILQPRLTTILIVMNANALHPYFSNLPSRYAHIIFFFIGAILLIYLLFYQSKLFHFYEYMNTILFSCMILCLVLCSESMLRSDFMNAQITLYMLGILSWCGEWVENRDNLYDKIT